MRSALDMVERTVTKIGRSQAHTASEVYAAPRYTAPLDAPSSTHASPQRFVATVALMVIWLAPLLIGASWFDGPPTPPPTHYSALTLRWAHDTTMTQPTFAFTQALAQSYTIDAAFSAYYTAHAGTTLLGAPLTPGIPTPLGWAQFFTSGGLLVPARSLGVTTPSAATSNPSATLPSGVALASRQTQRVNTPNSDEALRQAASQGQTDTATGIVRLALLPTLLSAGSAATLDQNREPLTYLDLRRATLPGTLASKPATALTPATAMTTPTTAGDVFITAGTVKGHPVGRIIPAAIWQAITRPTVAPDGWQVDLGEPLTQALTQHLIVDGAPHTLLLQAFMNGIVEVDNAARDASGAPQVTLASTGLDYLETLGPPSMQPQPHTPVWTMSNVALQSAPVAGAALAHMGSAYPLALTGQAQWVDGIPWYAVQFSTAHTTTVGWAPLGALSLSAPGVPGSALFDALSPDLAGYLAAQGGNAGAVVYDLTRNIYYVYNTNNQFIMASSAKVPIMLTFLAMTEQQGREPNDEETYLLTTMIENSNNDSAQALFNEINGAGAISAYMSRIGVGGIYPNPEGWGWSTVSPLAMVQLLTLLQTGKVLTAQDRALALRLMENIEPDEQIGVGDTAPQGATVAMKDGWVPGPDNYWAMNSSGIVTLNNETYIIAVYTHDDALGTGWDITRHVCSAVGQLLV